MRSELQALNESLNGLSDDFDGQITVQILGQAASRHSYTPARSGFAGDCVYALQRHFVDCMTSGDGYESTVTDYAKSVRLVEAAYASAASGQVEAIA